MTESKSKKQSNRDLLFSNKQEVVLKTINQLREIGSDTDLELLAELYAKTADNEIKSTVNQLFCDLKNQESSATITRLLKTISDKPTLKMLVSSCWQSRLNFIDSFEIFIDLVFFESFEISFEAFTVVENFEEIISDERKNKLISYAKEKLSKCKDENQVFAMDLIHIIEAY